MKDHAEGELGSEEGQEPLRGIHMSLQIQILEMRPQIWKLLLHTRRKKQKKRAITHPVQHKILNTSGVFILKCILYNTALYCIFACNACNVCYTADKLNINYNKKCITILITVYSIGHTVV